MASRIEAISRSFPERSAHLGFKVNEVLRSPNLLMVHDLRLHATVLRLTHWLGDPDLSGLRPEATRLGMPADEVAEWDALWTDVKTTIVEAQKPAPPPEVAPAPRPKGGR